MKYLFITSLFWSFNLFSQISLDPDKISQSAIDISNPDIENRLSYMWLTECNLGSISAS